MKDVLEPSLDTENDDLPDTLGEITEEDIKRYRELWLDWVAGDKKFLPEAGGLLDQPVRMMRTFFLFDSLADRVTRQLMKQQKTDAAEA